MPRATVIFPPLRLSRRFIDYPYFADLGALQAAALLREAGWAVGVADALATPGAALSPLGDDEVRIGADPVLEPHLAEADAVVVAYTAFHRPPAREPEVARLLERIRAERSDVPVVLADLHQSGQHVVDCPSEDVLAAYPEVDVHVRHEGEAVLVDLAERLMRQGRPPHAETLEGREWEPLDELPLPAWDLVDLPAYWQMHASVVRGLGRGRWAFPIDGPSLPMLSTRGCPYRCAHCSSNPGLAPGAPKRQRRYSEAYIGRHLDRLVALGARRVHLLDELANVNRRHFDALLEQLRVRDLRFEIPNGLRADHVAPRHLEAMRGRLTTLSVSAESGVQRVVDEVVGKDLDLDAIDRVCEVASDAGVPVLVHFMIGLPGETRRDINGTLARAIELHERTGAWPSVQYATPLPGTRLAAMAQGTRLPVVRDWGPRFQHAPSIETDAFTRQDLEDFAWTFRQRLEAGQGAKKGILNPTYKCNNRCVFCVVSSQPQIGVNIDRQKEFLLGCRRDGVSVLGIDGGEPTLDPNLLSLVRFARRVGFEKVSVTTNGRMCAYPDYARRLVASGVTSVLFSIHGSNAQMHAASVGVLEAFEQTTDGVKNCVRLAPDGVELGANITLTKTNFEHLGSVVRLVSDLGLSRINVQFLTPFGRATNAVAPDTARAAEITMRVIDDWKDRMRIQVFNLPFCYTPGYERYLVGDPLDLERRMISVDGDEVNLLEYLREQRHYEERCHDCSRKVFCGGFYRMDDVPEPRWLLTPEDRERPLHQEGLRPLTGNDARRGLPVV